MVSCHDVSVEFNGFVALRHASLCLSGRQVTGLAGANGAGKTTLIHALTGLVPLSSGRVERPSGLRSMSYCPDSPEFEPWLTAAEVLEQSLAVAASDGGEHRSPEAREALLGRVGLAGAGTRRVGGFSRGMKQRLGIAAAVVLEPKVLILDEPTSALDPLGREDVLALISELGRQMHVVFSSHLLGDIERVADALVVLDEGSVVFTGPLDRFVDASEAQLAITVKGSPAALIAALEAHGVGCSRRPERTSTLVVPASHRREVFEVLASHPDEIVAVEPSAASLQGAFVRLARSTGAA